MEVSRQLLSDLSFSRQLTDASFSAIIASVISLLCSSEDSRAYDAQTTTFISELKLVHAAMLAIISQAAKVNADVMMLKYFRNAFFT